MKIDRQDWGSRALIQKEKKAFYLYTYVAIFKAANNMLGTETRIRRERKSDEKHIHRLCTSGAVV